MRSHVRKDLQRKSAIALGLCVICLLFLLETAVAHRQMPNPQSPWLWAALGVGACVALAFAIYYRWRAATASD